MAEEKKPFKGGNIGSLIDLKAEYLNRKRDAKRISAAPSGAEIGKSSVLTLTKQEKTAKAEKSQRRLERIRHHEDLIRKEEAERDRQRKQMEEKSRLYDRMTNGEEVVYEDGSRAEFLVNFDVKRRTREKDHSSDEEGSVDTEQEREPTPPPSIRHYDPTEEKGRVFGPSHIPLPQNEDERQQKIKELKEASAKTSDIRQKRKKQLTEQKRAEREKLKRFRARLDLSPLPSTSEEEDNEEESKEQPCPSIQEGPEEKKRNFGVREWDSEKIGYNRWIQKERDIRENEFAPPSSYFRR